MSLQYLNTTAIGDALSCAWQQYLGTSEDPANGQWYTDGANGDAVGLYGGLTDFGANTITLDHGAAARTLQHIVGDSQLVENLFGLRPSANVNLSYQGPASVSNTHSNVAAVSNGNLLTIDVNETVTVGGGPVPVAFTFASTDSGPVNAMSADTFTRSVPVTVPSGKAYQVFLTALLQQVTIPYTVEITISGETETWFANPINGHYNWRRDAGTVFGWIRQYACAGGDSPSYSAMGASGIITLTGSVVITEATTFGMAIYDVTAEFQANPGSMRTGPGTPLPATAPLVQQVPF
jgi:hypothetical protein